MRRDLSLGYLMLPGVPPPDLVRIAAAVGCTGVSLSAALATMMVGPPSLLDDAGLRRETARALRESGVAIDLVEGVAVAPDTDLARARAVLTVMRALGATRFNLSFWEPDAARSDALLDGFLEIAAALEMCVTVEFLRLSRLRTLRAAAALCARRPGLQILVDALHLARAGETPADVAALDPVLIGVAQLCDAPAADPGDAAYWDEAMHERLPPGAGELPLRALLDALPADAIVALEVPMRARAAAGMPALARAKLAADAARQVMAAPMPG